MHGDSFILLTTYSFCEENRTVRSVMKPGINTRPWPTQRETRRTSNNNREAVK